MKTPAPTTIIKWNAADSRRSQQATKFGPSTVLACPILYFPPAWLLNKRMCLLIS